MMTALTLAIDWAHYLSGWGAAAIICLVIGLGLLGFEAAVPGFGVPGIGGILFLAGSVLLQARSIEEALVTIAVELLLTFVVMFTVFMLFRKGKLDKTPIVLTESINDDKKEAVDEIKEYIGKKAMAVKDLRPVGKIELDGTQLDAMTEGEFIKAGQEVVITGTDGVTLKVASIKEEEI